MRTNEKKIKKIIKPIEKNGSKPLDNRSDLYWAGPLPVRLKPDPSPSLPAPTPTNLPPPFKGSPLPPKIQSSMFMWSVIIRKIPL